VTLGFGEIIRVFLNNLDRPINLTNGPKGINQIDSMKFFGFDLGKPHEFFGFEVNSVSMYYYLFLVLVIVSVVVCHRLENSRIGRAWMAIREDEIAAKAMGINTRNLKLLAFGMGATFGGVSGSMFAAVPGFRLARILQPDGVGHDRRHGGAGRHRPLARRHPGRACCWRRCPKCCATWPARCRP
jgi:branched-chain amino acid transport system permease protein